jgi:ubiquinone/menaquinone biosynthesis C-methylase UbiE
MGEPSADVHHPLFARLYPRISATAESRGGDEHRRELLAGARGRALELGAGNGLNFVHYPAQVESVMAVEPEPHLRKLAADAARSAPVPVDVVAGSADALPAPDASIDVAVASLVLCTVPDQQTALDELRRVLRPGGELLFYEHVVARGRFRHFQRFSDATWYPHVAGGCHMARDTVTAIEGAGFSIDRCRRFGFAPGALAPKIPHVIGSARLRA